MASRSLFKRLYDPPEALELVSKRINGGLVSRILADGSIPVNIEDLAGRLIAENIYSPRPLPWYPRSLVDGCAVRSVDVSGAFEDRPVELRYAGRVRIGERPVRGLERGECWEVDTGGWVPWGADAVVPIEYVKGPSNGYVKIERGATPGSGIALPASDVATGDQIVTRGTPGDPIIVAALASIGIRRVKATRKVKVSVFSTGDELVEPGIDPGEVKIFDSNRFQIIVKLRSLGYDVVDLGIIGDDIEEVEDAIIRAVGEGSDIIIASGGTSAGIDDVVYRALQRRGEIVVHGLRIKPGKPTILGIAGVDRLFIGLPGNPRSAENVMDRVVIPLISRLGLPVYPPQQARVKARVTSQLPVERGRHTLIPVALVGSEEDLAAFIVAKDSYMIASYPKADGLTVVEAGTHTPPQAGSIIDVTVFKPVKPTAIALTDSILSRHASEEIHVKVLYIPTSTPEDVIKLLPETSNVYVIASIEGLEAAGINYSVIRRHKRDIILLKRRGNCSKTAVFTPYSNIAIGELRDVNHLIVPAPRAETALILVKQGYVDCAVLPSDLIGGINDGMDKIKVGEEEVVLARLG
ncbi:MAG: molybdopterin molybdotransferase MoeA [Desulfurococcales archaeon]|nr:molybdopterin molybdotransferase MoeA [Desulfurococcales archaeon]